MNAIALTLPLGPGWGLLNLCPSFVESRALKSFEGPIWPFHISSFAAMISFTGAKAEAGSRSLASTSDAAIV